MATVERIEGSAARVRAGETSASTTNLSPADTLRADDTIMTGADGRAAVRLATGASFRVDRASTARFVSADVIELVAGGVYVDSGPDSPTLELRTALGVIRKVGTQFEARLESGTLRIRVRSGLVEVLQGTERVRARAGNQLSISPSGATTGSVVTYGPEWNWAIDLAPRFDIDGRSLGAFLEYLCREQGWILVYDMPALAREAWGIVLSGSVEGLDTADALEVVLSTSGLSHHLENGVLTILRPTLP
jgi:ferric-dicitrate binding protein FerR (iron transport regulator)